MDLTDKLITQNADAKYSREMQFKLDIFMPDINYSLSMQNILIHQQNNNHLHQAGQNL